ncbi:hypothetical protein PR202_ga18854 [Eleusine coracana subsp. coracana]|uniref:Uncharacterized protein n=1 Tax=Eleusine coracana subsp. coracana TaxID=191504 RepID=A0AAV5CSY4_ELECO|nr:hypothetical protein PR202_ga18854 [Eleusine coracana subsp. coracana]
MGRGRAGNPTRSILRLFHFPPGFASQLATPCCVTCGAEPLPCWLEYTDRTTGHWPRCTALAKLYWSEELALTAVNLGCLGSSETVVQQSIQSLAVPDDGCRLVLGLGPTPDLYSAGSHSYGGNSPNESATFHTQHRTATDPGLMLGLSGCSSRNVQPTKPTSSKKYSHARKFGITIPLIDEGSTSGKRKVGGYMLPLLFAPRSEDLCPNGMHPETSVQHHEGTGCDSEVQLVGNREVSNVIPRSAGSMGVQKAQGVLQGFAFLMVVVRGAKSQVATKVAESRTAYCKVESATKVEVSSIRSKGRKGCFRALCIWSEVAKAEVKQVATVRGAESQSSGGKGSGGEVQECIEDLS